MGDIVGYLGIAFGLFVAPPQLLKIVRSKSIDGISYTTYLFLVIALVFYLLHAIYIQSIVFIISQSIGLLVNGCILVLMLKRRAMRSKNDKMY